MACKLVFISESINDSVIYSAENLLRISIGMILSVLMWVDAKNTGGATLASKASLQRLAQRHHRSPSFNPGKSHSGFGVVRSLPFDRENSRKSAVINAQTVCMPISCSTVWQNPSRKKPVAVCRQHGFNGLPKTFFCVDSGVIIVMRWDVELQNTSSTARKTW